jgi:hypothetical protein
VGNFFPTHHQKGKNMQTRESVDKRVEELIAEMKKAVVDRDYEKCRRMLAVMDKAWEILRGQ